MSGSPATGAGAVQIPSVAVPQSCEPPPIGILGIPFQVTAQPEKSTVAVLPDAVRTFAAEDVK